MKWTAPRMWEGGECFILGGGPSLAQQFDIPSEIIENVTSGKSLPLIYFPYLSPIYEKHVIGVNNAYVLGPWIDCLFFGDCSWYLVHRPEIAKWPNLKVTCCPRFGNKPQNKCEGIKFLAKDSERRQGISLNPGKVSWNSNSGAAAINLAVHFGVKRILLLGFDMVGMGKGHHWHKGHGAKKAPPYPRHLKGFPQIAEDAKNIGIEILNVSPNSVIESFPRVCLKDVL